jgi:hypothetical protein
MSVRKIVEELFKKPEKYLDYQEIKLRLHVFGDSTAQLYVEHSHINITDLAEIVSVEAEELRIKFKYSILRTNQCHVFIQPIFTGGNNYATPALTPIASIVDDDTDLGVLVLAIDTTVERDYNIMIYRNKAAGVSTLINSFGL